MAQKKVGELIKEARTKAGLSQEKLAAMIDGLSASEVSKAERGEKELSQAELKAIAKATGVTQKSLLEAAGYVSSAKKPTSSAKPASSTASIASKKPASSAAKKTDTAEIKLTAAEKRVLTLYRAASAAVRKDAEAVLKGEKQVQAENANPLMEGLLGGALDILSNIGKK